MLQLGNRQDASCPEDAELLKAIFHGKWRFEVLRQLAVKPTRLSALVRAIPGCSKKVLIDTLHGLEAIKLVNRVEFATKVKKVEYHLTAECSENVRRIVTSVDLRTARETDLS